MALSMFDPFSDPFFGEPSLTGGLDWSQPQQSSLGSSRRRAAMPADVIETPDSFVMFMDMPGCRQEDINLEVDGFVVRVSCEYKIPDEYQSDQVKWHRAGRPFGGHQRSLRFPESCDMSKIDAKIDNGSLRVCIAKRPEAKTHRIQIAGGGGQQSITAGSGQE